MEFLFYIIRRVLWSVVVLLGLSVTIFFIARVIPGDPARIALGPTATQEQVINLRREMGLDLPLPVQYVRYLSRLVQGDLGQSLLTQRSVNRDIAGAFPATFELVLTTIFLVVVIGIPNGVLAARFKDSWLDNVNRLTSLIGVVTPSFFLALLLQLLAGYVLRILPTSGRLPAGTDFTADITGLITIDALLKGNWLVYFQGLRHLLLPALALSATGIGQIARITRSSMIDVSRRDYIEAARAFGIPDMVTTFKYMLKPSFIPTLTLLGLTFASLLGNAFVVEMVFSWPGMASYGVRTILQKDFNAVIGVVMVIGAFFVVVNVIVDVLVGYVDPRVRLRGGNA
ncbi:MAG: ABC transporter permease [Deinococcota bacterium]